MFYFFKRQLVRERQKFRNFDAHADANAFANAEIAIPRFPNGRLSCKTRLTALILIKEHLKNKLQY